MIDKIYLTSIGSKRPNAIVPQPRKCLKFEAVWGGGGVIN